MHESAERRPSGAAKAPFRVIKHGEIRKKTVRHDMAILAAFIGSIWWYLMCGAILAVAIAAFVIMKKKQKEEED